MELLRFVQEEVERQGWGKPGSPMNNERTGFMLEAWGYALVCSKHRSLPTVEDCYEIAQRVEPQNRKGFRGHQLNFGCDFREVQRRIVSLFDSLKHVDRTARRFTSEADYTAGRLGLDSWYYEYEQIHPWADGNGRSGKVMYNWIHGTLLDPVLVADYFGHGVP